MTATWLDKATGRAEATGRAVLVEWELVGHEVWVTASRSDFHARTTFSRSASAEVAFRAFETAVRKVLSAESGEVTR